VIDEDVYQPIYDEYLGAYLDAMKERSDYHELKKAVIRKELEAAITQYKLFLSKMEGIKFVFDNIGYESEFLDRILAV